MRRLGPEIARNRSPFAFVRENRAKILEAARQAFAANVETVPSMNQIAQQAGVGAGTLYRNFATREELILAVNADEIDQTLALAPVLLEEHAPLEALRLWTDVLVAGMRRKHGLGDALSTSTRQSIAQQAYGPVIAAIEMILDAGKADGSIRMDADAGDFLQLTGALWRAAPGPEDRAPRMLALILDGMRAR